MDAACAATAGAMAAMIGADENAVRALAADTDVDVANLNAPGQIVISGESAKVEMAVSLAKEHGIRRATLLNVAGAYHSRLMNSAYEQLGQPLLDATLQMPRFPVMSCDRRTVETLPESAPRCRIRSPAQFGGPIAWRTCSSVAAISLSSLVGRSLPDCCAESARTRTWLASAIQRPSTLVESCADVEALAASATRSSIFCMIYKANRCGPERCDAAKDAGRLGVLRMLKSALKYAAIEKSDAGLMMRRPRRSFANRSSSGRIRSSFEKGGRPELRKRKRS
jgi:hypothetical protein